MKKLPGIILLILSFYCCNTKNNEPGREYIFAPPKVDTINPDEPFYPFVDYIQQQIEHIDTTPYGIEKIIYLNGITLDSSFISKEIFKQWANHFMEINPNDSSIKPKFTESSLKDLTINRIIFSISAIDTSYPLQQADVFINADNNKVKTVVLRKIFENADSTINQHLVWLDNRHFQISETISLPNKEKYVRITKIIWDKDPEQIK